MYSTSPPAQNARPAPVMTTARQPESPAAARSASSNSSRIVPLNAFSFSGRSRVMVVMYSADLVRIMRLLFRSHDPFDQLRILRQQTGVRQSRRQLAPAGLHVERSREERERLVDALHVHERHGVPVDHLRVAALRDAAGRRRDLLGGAVFAQRAFVVVVFRGQV